MFSFPSPPFPLSLCLPSFLRFRPRLKGFFISAEIFLAFAGELCYNLFRDAALGRQN